MSYEKRTNAEGAVRYVVRWRDSTGRSRSKTVSRQRDAIALDAEKKRQRALGELADHERGSLRLEEFWPLWKRDYGAVNVASRTLKMYDSFWNGHVGPELGRYPLRALTNEILSKFVAALSKKLASATVRRVLGMLKGILERAVEWGYLRINPARRVRRPRVQSRRGRALDRAQIEALAAELSPRSAAVVRVLAWTGLRPGELRALRWDDLSESHIRVERAAADDDIGPTKTRKPRSVELTTEARKALLEWYMTSGQPETGLIFPGRDGKLWRDGAYSHWGQSSFNPAASRAGLAGTIPYDLRHTFASWLIDEGRSVVEVAGQLGHSPTLTLETYAHEFAQQRAKPVASACHAKKGIREILSAGGAQSRAGE